MKALQNMTEGVLPINGIELYYKSIGEGPPVVMVHGGPGLGHGYLYPHFKQLADRYQVVFYDQRSSGKSSGHETPMDITMDNLIEDMEGLRKRLNIHQLNLMGHSWGGLIVQNYAIRYRQNLKTVILFGSMGASSQFIHKFKHTIASRLTKETVQGLKRLAREFGQSSHPAKVFQDYYSLFLKPYFYDERFLGKLSLGKFNDEMVEKHIISNTLLADYQKSYNLIHELKMISSPALIIHGEHDPIPFETAGQMHELIKGSELLLLKQCGHFPFIEKRDDFFQGVYAFLDTHLK